MGDKEWHGKEKLRNLRSWGDKTIKTSTLEDVKCPWQWLMQGVEMENSRCSTSPRDLLLKAIDRVQDVREFSFFLCEKNGCSLHTN